MSEEIQKTIDYLTQKFGSTGAELWQAIVAQMRFEGMMGISYFVFSVVALTALFYICKICILKAEKDKWSQDRTGMTFTAIIVASIFSLLTFIFQFCDLGKNISKINNPTYWAAKEILKK